jgi:glucose-6-phosphate-specific signal transduction histidine kinase
LTKKNKNLKRIFFWPTVLGFLIASALVTALIKDGLVEQLSLFGLILPIIVIAYFYWVKSK